MLGKRSTASHTAILVAIDKVNRAHGSFGKDEHHAGPALVLPKSPAVPIALLPELTRRQLLHFAAGKRLIEGHLVHDFFELHLDARANFKMIRNSSFSSFNEVEGGPLEGVNDRVAFLNRKGMVKGLFGTKDPVHNPLYLRIKRVLLENDEWQRAKVSFLMGEKEFVLPVEKIDGKWLVGERWDRQAYRDVENVIRNDDFFRPRGAKPRQ